MPELPEVETTRRGIIQRLQGKRATGAIVRNARLRWPVPQDLAAHLADQQLLDIRRRAKYLLFIFENGVLIVHLGMSGSLRVLTEAFPPERHEHIDLLFDGGLRLRYRDPRRFGAFLWHAGDPASHPLLCKLGPEPLSESFSAQYLQQALHNKKIAIKIAIMDQHIVVGVGNIYASEALFRARILPQRPASQLSLDEASRLTECIREVLSESILAGGSTLRDYVDSDGKAGYFMLNNYVYGRAGMPCRLCQGTIQTSRQGQRSSYWCAQCQQ